MEERKQSEPEKTTLYELLTAAGVPLDSHESDLYAKVTPESKAIIQAYQFRDSVRMFRSSGDNQLWYDIPFANAPFWERKMKTGG